ncbi:Leucine rich repeat containing protein BspA family protein [Entamoeba marina]
MNNKQLDSYSVLIVSKYLLSSHDYINVICVCKKFQETTEKLRFNPIPIPSLKLFPKIQTQHIYNENDSKIEGIDNYEIWYKITYDQYLQFKKNNIKCYHYCPYFWK